MRMKAILFLIIIALISLTYPTLGGQGCGSNWLGNDAVGYDPDFNYATIVNGQTGSSMSGASSASSTGAASSISSPNRHPEINNLTADPVSPREQGAEVTWTADASDQDKDPLMYKFLLNGEAVTDWDSSNTWVWDTTDAIQEINDVEVWVRDGKHSSSDNYDSRLLQRYTLKGVDSMRPISLDDKDSKPRIPPDERLPLNPTNANPVNMSMPDPMPIKNTQIKQVQGSGDSASDDQVSGQADDSLDDQPVRQAEQKKVPKDKPKAVDFSGKWSVKMNKEKGVLNLILIQTGSTIMGSGSLISDGSSIPVTASGSTDDSDISLKVKTVIGDYVNKVDKQFMLDMTMQGKKLSGSYEAYDGEDLTSEGIATCTTSSTSSNSLSAGKGSEED
jgi:hypothetical protein